ncbi:MAG TPA: hypothetical protein VM487_06130 [Phycisphaerae bacterium]|nr:hypothetical protein [Phycisphaerae bacterium]
MIGDDLEYVAAVQMASIILAAGHDNGTIYFELSNDNGVTTDTLRNGETRAAIADGDAQQPAISVLFTGEILVSLMRGMVVITYLSSDWGESWTAIDQVV